MLRLPPFAELILQVRGAAVPHVGSIAKRGRRTFGQLTETIVQSQRWWSHLEGGGWQNEYVTLAWLLKNPTAEVGSNQRLEKGPDGLMQTPSNRFH